MTYNIMFDTIRMNATNTDRVALHREYLMMYAPCPPCKFAGFLLTDVLPSDEALRVFRKQTDGTRKRTRLLY